MPNEPQPVIEQPQHQALPAGMPEKMRTALAIAGVSPEQVTLPSVAAYVPWDLEALCWMPTTAKSGTGQSPLMVVTNVQLFPEAKEFKGYIGFFRAEAVTDTGEFVSWSSHMVNAETGEQGPLYQWVRDAKVPFPIRVVRVATRTPGRHVFRPMPVSKAEIGQQ